MREGEGVCEECEEGDEGMQCALAAVPAQQCVQYNDNTRLSPAHRKVAGRLCSTKKCPTQAQP